EQEGVVPVRRVDLGVGDASRVGEQRLDDLAAAIGREPPVGHERNDEEVGLRTGQGAGKVAAMRERRIEVVERAGDQQIRVRVEVRRELLALVAQVRLDLELDVE